MKTFKLIQSSRSIGTRVGMLTVLGALAAFGFSSHAYAFNQINSQLYFGKTGGDVTSLQEFLAASPDLYPRGLITGYYGALTEEAVEKFQVKYDIVSSGSPSTTGYGRVGPMTMAKINGLINNNSGVANTSGPAIFMQYFPQITSTTATFNWMTTNGAAYGRLYYSTSPLQMNEGDINSNGFAVTSGQIGSYDGIARSSQSSYISGLQPNTTYYYTIVATDLGGNVSVIGPNNTFRTSAQ